MTSAFPQGTKFGPKMEKPKGCKKCVCRMISGATARRGCQFFSQHKKGGRHIGGAYGDEG